MIDRIRRAIAPLYEPREAEQIARRFTFERPELSPEPQRSTWEPEAAASP